MLAHLAVVGKEGGMNIDWIVAIGIFLTFTVWAFTFYGQLFTVEQQSVGDVLEIMAEKVMENLTVKVHSIPVNVNYSNVSVSNAILYFEYRWPFGENSTKVYLGSSSKTCNISNNRVYWQSDLGAYVNSFRMKYSEQKANLSCTGGFTVVNETQVIPLAIEETKQVSNARISEMNATNYSVFKAFLGINRDFNITIENASVTLLSYGLMPPRATDVFSQKMSSKLEETEENITIRFLTW